MITAAGLLAVLEGTGAHPGCFDCKVGHCGYGTMVGGVERERSS